MFDIRFLQIEKENRIVFIVNKRGENPRLVYGHVVRADEKSIVVQDADGDYHWLRRSKRAYDDGRMLNVAVIMPRTEHKGDVVDCTGYPISVGDNAVFMEAPSQGYCTSLTVGEVLRVSGEIVLKVYSSTFRKFMRKPNDIAVVEHTQNG